MSYTGISSKEKDRYRILLFSEKWVSYEDLEKATGISIGNIMLSVTTLLNEGRLERSRISRAAGSKGEKRLVPHFRRIENNVSDTLQTKS